MCLLLDRGGQARTNIRCARFDKLLIMNLRQLTIFLAVVDHDGVGRAADALFMAQPAVSQTLRRLEEDLHVALFERNGRRVVLTEAGQALVGPAREVLKGVDIASDAVAAIRGFEYGTLRITALPSLSLDPLPGLIAAFCKKYPNLSVKADIAFDATQVLEAVRAVTTDIGFATELTPDHLDGVVTKIISEQELFFAFPPGVSQPASHAESLKLLEEIPFVAGVPGTRTRALLDELLASGARTRILAEVMDRDMVVRLIIRGVGCGIVASPYAEKVKAAGGVVAPLSPRHSVPVRAIYRQGTIAASTAAFLSVIEASSSVDPIAV